MQHFGNVYTSLLISVAQTRLARRASTRLSQFPSDDDDDGMAPASAQKRKHGESSPANNNNRDSSLPPTSPPYSFDGGAGAKSPSGATDVDALKSPPFFDDEEDDEDEEGEDLFGEDMMEYALSLVWLVAYEALTATCAQGLHREPQDGRL